MITDIAEQIGAISRPERVLASEKSWQQLPGVHNETCCLSAIAPPGRCANSSQVRRATASLPIRPDCTVACRHGTSRWSWNWLPRCR